MTFRNFESWREEKQSAYLYRILAEKERGTPREKLYLSLAEMAEKQALEWTHAAGLKPSDLPAYHPPLKVKAVQRLIGVFGPHHLKTVLAALKIRGLSVYSAQLAPEIQAHAMPSDVSELGGRHRLKGSAGNIRAAIFGVNDGLVSTASLMLGASGAASGDPRIVLISGGAGLLAGAMSMAAGEYVSVRSQRELLEYQLALERAELKQYPEEEAAELALIYAARGIPEDQAREIAARLIANPERALETLAREELGLDPTDLGSPWAAALSSFGAFSIGGLVPLLPFVFSPAGFAMTASIGATAIALFATGAVVSLFSGRGVVLSGLRMLLIGGGAGALAYLLGTWVA
ncbi:MAG: hypothetical protein A2X94_05760 [Bdellovibrionales bacterium GWB1_55_8]|nr:MAG: hypothetical protein A2X94_05760 [Bdellovibrionales bacterium GWB1_55_8]